jgi:hypothetical protein
MNQQFTQDFIANALATFLGVLAGIPVALWLDRLQQRRHETASTTNILTLLRAELDHD